MKVVTQFTAEVFPVQTNLLIIFLTYLLSFVQWLLLLSLLQLKKVYSPPLQDQHFQESLPPIQPQPLQPLNMDLVMNIMECTTILKEEIKRIVTTPNLTLKWSKIQV